MHEIDVLKQKMQDQGNFDPEIRPTRNGDGEADLDDSIMRPFFNESSKTATNYENMQKHYFQGTYRIHNNTSEEFVDNADYRKIYIESEKLSKNIQNGIVRVAARSPSQSAIRE